MLLHADAVAENCSPGVGTGWIHSDDPYRALMLAIEAGQLIDQRALPCSRRAGQAEHTRLAAVRKQSLQQIGPSGRAILHGRDGTSQGAHIPGAKLRNPWLDGLVQTISVKQRTGKKK